MKNIGYFFEPDVAKIISEMMIDIELNRGDYIAERWISDIIEAIDSVVSQPFPNMYIKVGDFNCKVSNNGKKIYFVILDDSIVIKSILF